MIITIITLFWLIGLAFYSVAIMIAKACGVSSDNEELAEQARRNAKEEKEHNDWGYIDFSKK